MKKAVKLLKLQFTISKLKIMTPTKFLIVSDSINAEEFHQLLNQNIKQEGLTIDLEKQPEDSMALDPFEVVATVLTAIEVLTPIVEGIFTIVTTKINAKRDIKVAEIEANKTVKVEQIKKEVTEVEADKAIKLAEIEANKAIELAKIQAEKEVKLAEIHIRTTEGETVVKKEDLDKEEVKEQLDLMSLEKVKAIQAFQEP